MAALSERRVQEIREEIRAMFKADQVASLDEDWDSHGVIVRKNTARLKEIMREIGEPSVEVLGENGAMAAWLIAQHSLHDIPFMKEFLERMRKLYRRNPKNVYVQGIPLLIDRIRVNEGKKQLYGSQFRHVDGKLEPHPISSMELLEERRRRFGLEPFEEYVKTMRSSYER